MSIAAWERLLAEIVSRRRRRSAGLPSAEVQPGYFGNVLDADAGARHLGYETAKLFVLAVCAVRSCRRARQFAETGLPTSAGLPARFLVWMLDAVVRVR
jgi:hypothetical protein